ncbi:hypothetical protein pgond44_14923 [Psychroflexus gondwanensis ACAM 44]|jgi:hypothetical protein|uniref:Uncharacterized protein n=1 Tax=Psychroflexus gondwanensis ACAM 44 TaxID=1189619 RepID=N1WVF4_9FLAO|nr:hypothetical protein [Psychroflexus gondwanensis]EMY79838.1 hypothetical protein pgond44_14923 [Psychroflexus gondwanensis ACAM 44]
MTSFTIQRKTAYFLWRLENKKVVKKGKWSKALVKRFALRGGTAFVVFKDIKISLVFFVSFLGDAKKKRE